MKTIRLICLFIITLTSQVWAVESSIEKQLFSQVKPLVYQIKTSSDANSSKASYGTGFVVDESGLLITNYHVISSVVQDRFDIYKIFVVDKEKNLEAEIIDFSVIHDLALIKINKQFSNHLLLERQLPERGNKIFSVGLPKDLNMSIVAGNYNGIIKRGAYERFLMSTPVNSGMSGGPTIDQEGQVVGVNVSIMLNSENISFAVPARFASDMLDKFKEKKKRLGKKEYRTKIENQLRSVETSLLKTMKSDLSKSNKVGSFSIASPSNDLKCWTRNGTSKKNTYKYFRQTCYLKNAAFLQDGIYSGTYELTYIGLQNINRNKVQFNSIIGKNYSSTRGHTSVLAVRNKSPEMTKFSCEEDIYVNKNNIPFKVSYCLNSYIRYKGLYRVMFKAATLNQENVGLIMKIQGEGFSKEGVKDFISYHIDNIAQNKVTDANH